MKARPVELSSRMDFLVFRRIVPTLHRRFVSEFEDDDINRSYSDIRKCMQLARAADPVAALNEERATARSRMTDVRSKKNARTFARLSAKMSAAFRRIHHTVEFLVAQPQ
jgi:hypothetical protein